MNITVLTGLSRFYSGFVFPAAKSGRGGCRWLLKTAGRCLVPSILFLLLLPGSSTADSLGQNYYSIHVGSFKEKKWAVDEVEKLLQQGRDAFFQLETIKGKGEFYRVYINKYKRRIDAEKDADQLKRQKVLSYYLIQTLSGTESKLKVEESDPAHQKPVSAGKSVENEKRESVLKENEKAVTQKGESSLLIRNIVFRRKGEKTETVLIYGDQHFWPMVLFSNQKEVPGVTIVVKNVAGVEQDDWKRADIVNGVRKIHTRLDRNEKTLKIRLYFRPSTIYSVLQFFDKADNIYRFEVTVGKEAEGRSSLQAVDSGPEKADNLKIVYRQPEQAGFPGANESGELRRQSVRQTNFSVPAGYSDILALIEFWRKAWENKQLEDYIACYDAAFQSEDKDLAAWKLHKQKIFKSYRRIMVELSAIEVKAEDNNVRAYFRQKYSADYYHDDGYKIIELKNVNGRWKISAELWYAEKPAIWPHSS